MTQHPYDPTHSHPTPYPPVDRSDPNTPPVLPVDTLGTAYVLPPQPPAYAEAPAPTYSCDLPPSRFLMSLTGFDEIAIAVRFGQKIGELREDAVTAGRALAFVHMRRLGAKDPEAYEQSMSMTMQEVVDYFAPEPKGDDTQLDDASAPSAPSAEGN